VNIVERAKNLILQPSAEWDRIDGETHTVQGLYTGWIMILAAIGPVAAFIGHSIIGAGAFGISYRVPILHGIAVMIASYAMALGMVYVFALVIDALAPSFDGTKDFGQAFKVAAFAPTASWLASVFGILPLISILSILGLYSLYLLWVGLPKLMKVPEAKAAPYTVVVILVGLVIAIVIGTLTAFMVPGRAFG
jgi:Yip1 domain